MAGRWARPSAGRWLGGPLVGVAGVAAVSGIIALVDPHVPALNLLVLYMLVVLAVAVVWGTGLAAVTSVLSAVAFAYLFVPPIHSVWIGKSRDLTALGVFLITAVVVGQLAARSRRQALESVLLSKEQSALRRVATLVAQGVPPSEVFEAVTREVGLLCGADLARMERYEDDGTVTGVAAWGRVPVELAVGTRFSLDGPSIARGVQQTGGAVRVDSFGQDAGAIALEARAVGIRASVGCPIVVGGRLWGVIAASTRGEEPFPRDIETQIAGFTELVATAIANAQARQELQALADEQAALRRVATLVARGEPPAAVFTAVAEEVGRLLPADFAVIGRYEPDGAEWTGMGDWSRVGDPFGVGRRLPLGGDTVSTRVHETGRTARMASYDNASGTLAADARALGIGASVGVPITVAGRLWGVIIASSTYETVLPADTEQRLADFTKLVATAIANAEAHAELTDSRARIVATADQTRRRIERDLHDGAQQRLVSLALRLRSAATAIPAELSEVQGELAGVGAELDAVQGDLRELSRGIHPAILSEGGLSPALRALARRSPVPVQLQLGTRAQRLPERIEVTAYYVVSEALTNVAKHANASLVEVDVDSDDALVRLAVRDNGVGGADPTRGSGLVGLRDRVEATHGTLRVDSRPGQGTSLLVQLPLDGAQPPHASRKPEPAR
jgi:signal transduction histidine kinase